MSGDREGARVVALVMLALVAVTTVSFAVTGTDLPDPDIWWNVADGAHQWRTGHSDASLAMFGAHGCPDPQPLVTVVSARLLALSWLLAGNWGLVVVRALCVALIGLATWLSFHRSSLVERTAWATCVVAAVSLRASPRPEIVGLALFAIACALLRAYDVRGSRAALVGLVVVQAVMTWTFGSFILTPLVCGALLVGHVAARGVRGVRDVCDVRDVVDARRAVAPLVAVLVGTCARPSAFFGFVNASTERALGKELGFREWMSPFVLFEGGWHPPALGPLLLVVVAGALGAAWCFRFEDRGRAIGALLVLLPLFATGLDANRALIVSVCAAPLFLPFVTSMPARPRRWLSVAALVAAALVSLTTLSVDPWVSLGAPARAFAPARTTPIGPGEFLRQSAQHGQSGLVYAPLHAGGWLVLLREQQLDDNPDDPGGALDVVWSGRRTYSAACGRELLRGRAGGAAFDSVDARLRPQWVLALHATESALVDTLVERGFHLAYIDLRYALFARTSPQEPLRVDVDALQRAETRPLDAVTFRALLTSACRTLTRAAPTQAGPTCDAVRRLPEGVGLDVTFD